MMRISLRVQYVDGSEAAVVAAAPDLIAFERQYDKPMSVFASDARIEWLLFLAWTSLKRQKQTAEEFDAWTERVDGIIFGDDVEDEIVPLESSQPTG